MNIFFASVLPHASILNILPPALVLYFLGVGIYRLYFHPLAGFPGPKLAALTQWYETYYEVFKAPGGQFMFQCRKLHDIYGPIVRINPFEVHIQDSEFYSTVYTASRSWDKPKYLKHRFASPNGVVSTPSHELHRHRRAAVGSFFTKRKVSEFVPLLQQQMNRLCKRLNQEYRNTGKAVCLEKMFGCFTADTIVLFCFDGAYNWLDAEDFHCEFVEAVRDLVNGVHLGSQFPWLAQILQSLPDSVIAHLNPLMKSVNEYNEELRRQISEHLDNKGEKDPEPLQRPTVFRTILESDLPPKDLSIERLQQEAVTLIGAGVETVRWSLAVASFHILDNPTIFHQLRKELEDAIPDLTEMPSFEMLEQLPYLSACIEESFRLSYGTTTRLARTSDTISISYGSYHIPAGSTISMDNYSCSHDEAIFPDSHTFIPERWLGKPVAPNGKPLSNYMVNFGRGRRSCIGKHLAYAQMYIVLANVFRKFEFELYETDRTDIECAKDMFVAFPKDGSLGVRVLVK